MFFVAISRPCYQRFAAGAITFARSKRAQTPAAVSPAVIANIERQLNAIAPHHIRVTICVGRGGMAVRIRSWRWLQWQAGMAGRASDGEDAIEDELVNVLLDLQWFICNGSGRAWPSSTPLPKTPADPSRESIEQHSSQLVALVPDAEVSIHDGVLNLWWEKEGRTILALEPIPIAEH